MRFDDPAGPNLIDGLRSIGRPEPRVEGKLKVTGTAHYAADRQIALDQAYGYILGAQIAKGRITAMRVADARETPGVIAVLAADDYSPFPSGHMNTASLFGGADVAHYHQPIALVVAETFEQARAASALIQVDYEHEVGAYSLAEAARGAPLRAIGKAGDQSAPIHRVGDFDGAFASAPVTVDETYTTPDQTHAMIEPHATVAVWEGHRLTVWTSTQLVHESQADLANSLGIPREDVHLESPYIGGGFGAKLFIRADLLLAALGARESGRAVKLTLQRPLIANNTTHRPATIQRVRLGATPAGVLTALGHASTSGNLPGGMPEPAVALSKLLYGAPNREIEMRLAVLDLPEGSAMRAPGEAPGLMAFEIAMDELSEKLGMDPVELRIINDTQVDPANSERLFSERHLVECLRVGAARFGWSQRPAGPRQRREGNALIGMGVAVGMRNNQLVKSAARIRLERNARLTVETDMTDIGTGSYTILAQTAAEMMGVPVSQVDVRLGRSDFPISAGSGGQWGANNATAGLYAACLRLRDMVSTRLGFDPATAHFADGLVRDGNRSCTFEEAAQAGAITAEDGIEYGDLGKRYQQSTFVAHFVEVAVDAYTGETRILRMLAVCDAGRILNPQLARSQVIGAMTMGVGAALMEELAVDEQQGFFVNHDLASYEVPVHADIFEQDVIFLDYPDDKSSPMKAKGVGELGLCGVAAAIANAIYNATGVRVRGYPITPDKLFPHLPRGGEGPVGPSQPA